MNLDEKFKRKSLLAGLLLGMFFSSLDQTVVGTAMPRIIGELGGLDILTWVSIAYMLTSTSIVPIAGKLADIFGRRIMYISGISIFIFGSALCGLSQNMTQLIIFRGIQGFGAGIMMPLAFTIVGDVFPPEQRGKWQGIMGALFGLSAIVGPLMGGWIVDHSTWRWVFYINLPVGFLAVAAIYIGLYGEKPLKEKAEIDFVGAITLMFGVTSLLVGLTLGGKDYPWNSVQIIGLLVSSLFLIVFFILIEKRAPDPILSIDFFKNKNFTISNSVGFLMGMGMFGTIMFLPLYLQGAIGLSATKSGSMMIPMVFSIIIASILSGRLIRYFQFRVFFIAGMLLIALGFYLLSHLGIGATRTTAIIDIIFIGCGIGIIMPSVTISVQNAFPLAQRGVATSSIQFFRSIGATLGMAIFGAIMNFKSIDILQNGLFPKIHGVKELSEGVVGAAIEKAHANPQSLYNLLLKPDVINSLPENAKNVLLTPLKAALADSLHLVFYIAMFLAVAGAVIGFFIGSERIEKKTKKKSDEKNESDDYSSIIAEETL